MDEQQMSRFEVVVEQGSPHGDLYELEQTTYYQVVDRHSKQIVMVFECQMEASLSRTTGMWDDYQFTGAVDVRIAPDGQSVLVKYHDGHEEIVPLPRQAQGALSVTGMDLSPAFNNPKEVASEIDAEIRALPVRNTPNERAIRRNYSQMLKQTSPEFVLDVAGTLLKDYGYRSLAYELIASHRAAFQRIGEAEVEELGQGIDGWGSVDSFARTLAGPAWLRGQISGELIRRWAHSEDRWWRRAALVSTVALNVRSNGGPGDVARTLGVCRLLVADQDDMVVKAMSWALRALAAHDAGAVDGFLSEHEDVLAARVKREVRNKLTTGLKNPRGKRN
jgi:3-methyladenine DNA glycosylase AlkD